MSIFKQAKLCAEYLSLYLRGTRGVAAMEYAIIVGVVVVGVGIAVAAFQDDIQTFIGNMGDRLENDTFDAPDAVGG